MARADSPCQSDSDHEMIFGTDGKRWCACDKCFEGNLAVEEESKVHNLLHDIEERSKRREQMTMKQNSRAQNCFIKQCRILEKERNDVNERLKRETVSNILQNYALLREAEKCQDEHFFEEVQSMTNRNKSYISKCDVPTIRIRGEDSCNAKTKQHFKTTGSTDLRLYKLQNSSINLSVKGESWKRYEERIHGRTTVGESKRALSMSLLTPTFEPPKRCLSIPPDFQRHTIQSLKGRLDTETITNNRSLSRVEGKYFHERIQNVFNRNHSNTPRSLRLSCDHTPSILSRKPDISQSNNTMTNKKYCFLKDAAKHGYKWVFTPGTETEIQSRKNQNVNIKEKIQVRSSELADIKQELKRGERNLNRIVRRSHSLVKDLF